MGTKIVRSARPDSGFLLVLNTVARDYALSPDERGVLIEMLSHADGFQMSAEAIAKRNNIGLQVARRILQNLEKAGYIQRRRIHNNESGKFDWEVAVYDTPQNGRALDEVKAPAVKADPMARQAARLVSDVWEPAVKGTTSQNPAAVKRVVENALRNGVKANAAAKALATLAAAKTTVSAYQFNKALNGEPVRGQLKADQKVDWTSITSNTINGETPF